MLTPYKSEKLSTMSIISTEDASSQEKDSFERKAAMSRRINLLSRSFGRGADFICNNSDVINNGGIHVLQTFLSEELSEET